MEAKFSEKKSCNFEKFNSLIERKRLMRLEKTEQVSTIFVRDSAFVIMNHKVSDLVTGQIRKQLNLASVSIFAF